MTEKPKSNISHDIDGANTVAAARRARAIAAAAAAAGAARVPERVIVHPLVLLSVVDHYNRVASKTKRRVVGVLLGQQTRGPGGRTIINVANSFAVPFEEDENDASVWFLDHNYVETMNAMFRKVNAREAMVGWYHTGPKLRSSDLEINAMFKTLLPNKELYDPVVVVVDVDPGLVGMPADSYFAIEEIKDDGSPRTQTFMHVPSAIEAEEAEEIGVEHLLRDIKGASIGSLSTRLHDSLLSLRSLSARVADIRAYIASVAAEQLPVNHPILNNLQHIFNLLPHLDAPALSRAFQIKNNDEGMVMYLASVVRAVLALHNLIDNKLANKEAEEQQRHADDMTLEPSANKQQCAAIAAEATSSNGASEKPASGGNGVGRNQSPPS